MKTKLLNQEQKKYIYENYQKLPYKDIAKYLNCTVNQVGLLVTRSGLNKDKKNIKIIRKYSLNEKYFDIIDNHKKSYIIGFILADGCICNNRLIITISQKDKQILHFIKDELEYKGNIIDRIILNKISNKKSNMSTLAIGSEYMINILKKMGIKERKTYLSIVPNISEQYIGSFLRGFFDGDGSIGIYKYDKNIHKTLSFSSQNKEFLENLREILKLKEYGNIVKQKYGYTWNINKLKEIYEIFRIMYDNNDFYLERKYNIFLDIFKEFNNIYNIEKNKFIRQRNKI